MQGSEAYKFLGHSHNIEKMVVTGESHYGDDYSYDEDTLILDHLPNMNVHIPSTEAEVVENMMEEYDRQGPSYMRI